MDNKLLDENNIISNPVYYGRSKAIREVGYRGEFRSRGWKVTGTIQKVIQTGLRQGFNVYLLEKVEEIKFYGIEMTKDEIEEYRKKQLKK